MVMRISLFILFLSTIHLFGQQDPGASIPLALSIEIENMELDSSLAKCNNNEDPCGWYYNEITINSGGEPWRAVGTYQKTIRFWYYDDPQFADIEDENANETWVLRKVEVTINSTYSEKTSLYYYKGNLTTWRYDGIFGGDDDVHDLSYFLNGVMIDGGSPMSTTDSYSETILKWALHYQDLFLATFK